MNIDEEDISNLNIINGVKIAINSYKNYTFDYSIYRKKYNLSLWISLFFPTLYKWKIPYIDIANQYIIDNWIINFIVKISKSIPVSILFKNNYSKYYIPPLINNKLLNKKSNTRKICLAYAGEHFHFEKKIIKIANNNKKWEIKYFARNQTNKNFPKNIKIFKPSKDKFLKYMKLTKCVLCTSGFQLTQECIFNNIPVAIMPCSQQHFEQVFNFNKYTKILKWAVPITSNLNLDKLSKRNINKYTNNLKKLLLNRNQIIKKNIKKIIKNH